MFRLHHPINQSNRVCQTGQEVQDHGLVYTIWINGTLKTRASSKKLTIVDGSADIAIGYHIDKGTAEIYRE